MFESNDCLLKVTSMQASVRVNALYRDEIVRCTGSDALVVSYSMAPDVLRDQVAKHTANNEIDGSSTMRLDNYAFTNEVNVN